MSSLVDIHILVSEFMKKSKCIYTISGVDYAGDVSPSLFIKSKFVPRTFSLDSCVLDMLRF